MTHAILNWLWKVPLLTALTLIAYVINPLLALFITKAEESETTGFPSLHPGMKREFLIKPLRIWQSEDAPVDEYYYANYEMDGWIQTYLRRHYESSRFVRYVYRLAWLYRNPAYGFGNMLGYNSTGMYFTIEHDNGAMWHKGKTNSSWWVARNSYGEIGWCYHLQWHFYKRRCLEIYIGYKLLADGRKKSVAIRFNPFKQYPK